MQYETMIENIRCFKRIRIETFSSGVDIFEIFGLLNIHVFELPELIQHFDPKP